MVDYYALAGFHSDAVEDRSLDDARAKAEARASRFGARPYAVAPRRPANRPLEIANAKADGAKPGATKLDATKLGATKGERPKGGAAKGEGRASREA